MNRNRKKKAILAVLLSFLMATQAFAAVIEVNLNDQTDDFTINTSGDTYIFTTEDANGERAQTENSIIVDDSVTDVTIVLDNVDIKEDDLASPIWIEGSSNVTLDVQGTNDLWNERFSGIDTTYANLTIKSSTDTYKDDDGNVILTGDGEGVLNVTADSSSSAAIGSDYGTDMEGSITIESGTVNATSGDSDYEYPCGAGIGSGMYGNAGGSITINGGTVNAAGGTGGAGIGSGAGGNTVGTIEVNGGTVTATGGAGGAGIGSGMSLYDDLNGEFIGGKAESTSSVTINGGTVIATGGAGLDNTEPVNDGKNKIDYDIGGGAGIGSGAGGDSEASVTINGGTVIATGGEGNSESEGSSGGSGAGIGTGATNTYHYCYYDDDGKPQYDNSIDTGILMASGKVTMAGGTLETDSLGAGEGGENIVPEGGEIEDKLILPDEGVEGIIDPDTGKITITVNASTNPEPENPNPTPTPEQTTSGESAPQYILWNEKKDISAVVETTAVTALIETELTDEQAALLIGEDEGTQVLRACYLAYDAESDTLCNLRFHFDKEYFGRTVEIRQIVDGTVVTKLAKINSMGMVISLNATLGAYAIVLVD